VKKVAGKIKRYFLCSVLVVLVLSSTPLSANAADTPLVPGLQCYNAFGWSASKIIYNSAQWYGINPWVILATLQKEQSLISTTTLNQYALDWAMGYGVPDSGDRDYSRQGFSTQVDWGAWQLSWNMYNANHDPSKVTPYYTGSNSLYIDGVKVIPANGATSSLYRYTPHFHGNQNFRTIMNIYTNPDVAWSPQNIIDDTTFSNKNTLTEAQIQAFLVAQNSYLKNYTESRNVSVGPDSYQCPLTISSVFRFYNRSNGTHFYTASVSEKNAVIAKWSSTYRYEGVAYNLNYGSGRNIDALYRFYNGRSKSHFYTANVAEKNAIIAKWPTIFRYEGIAWNVSKDPTDAMPVYRFYNKINGSHFYTASVSEKNAIIAKWASTYRYEGPVFYIPY